jgi:hypothetical protein
MVAIGGLIVLAVIGYLASQELDRVWRLMARREGDRS